MDVHVWYPYLSLSIEGDTFKKEMAEREKIFKAVPYIDGLLIPAGDPGDLPPKEMFQAGKSNRRCSAPLPSERKSMAGSAGLFSGRTLV